MRVSWKKTLLVSNKRSFHTRRIFVCFRTPLSIGSNFILFGAKTHSRFQKHISILGGQKNCRLRDLVDFIKIKF